MQTIITSKPTSTLIDNYGILRTRAVLGRVGVQLYFLNGESVRLLRPENEVRDSAASLSHQIVTLDHPSVEVTSDNTQELQKGLTGEAKYADGILSAPITVTSKDAIEKALTTHKQISCGYSATLRKESGVWVDEYGVHGHAGQSYEYDYVQTNIRGNHVALVERGRAGVIASLQLDTTQTNKEDLETQVFLDSANDFDIVNVNDKIMTKQFIFNDAVLTIAGDNADEIVKALNSQKESIKTLNDSLSSKSSDLTSLKDSLSAKSDEVSNLAGQLEALKVQLADAQTAKVEIETKLADAQSSTIGDSEISDRIAAWNQVLPVMQRDKADYKPNYSYSVAQIRAEYLKSKAPHLEQQLKDGNDAFIAGLWEGLKPGEESATTEDLRMTLDAADVTPKPTKQISRNRPISNK
jgi:hypothetical protein